MADTLQTVASDVRALMEALAAPFEASEVKFRPGPKSGDKKRVLAFAYVGARAVMHRLDEVLGVAGWQDDYELLPDGCMLCRLRVRVAGEWLLKADVGGPSKQKEAGDRCKAAVSGALKRAALKYGLARYLADLPPQWADWDESKQQFVKPPRLPGAAAGGVATAPPPPKGKAGARATAPASPEAAGSKARGGYALPSNGVELQTRLAVFEARLVAAGLCRAGELVRHVTNAGVLRKCAADMGTWTGPAIAWAVEEAHAYEAERRQAATGPGPGTA
jgi:hypothetical protein